MTSSGSPQDNDDVIPLDHIRNLAELMQQHDLSEVDLRQNEHRIRLRRSVTSEITTPPVAPIPLAPESRTSVGNEDDDHIVQITSPMVGTFYTKANPEAEPFVKMGDTINKNTTVCIIEAMKVFNEIPADVSGKIVAILMDNEDAVEFGKPLFKVDTSK